MNATSFRLRGNRERGAVHKVRIKDKANHFLLNKLLVLRYHVRKKPALIRAIIFFESALIKIHLIKI